MSNLMDLIQSQLSDGMIDQLTKQIGGADKQQTATAANGIMNTLIGALAKNASSNDGASAIANALDNDHDGGILDNIMDLIGGNQQAAPQQARTMNGAGILKHILGGNQGNAIQMISQMSGLDNGKAGNLMATLAPVVMGLLGKQKREQGLDASGLAGLLSNMTGQQREQKQQNPALGMITSFLDADGDGNIMDDIAGQVGKGLLSKLSGGRK